MALGGCVAKAERELLAQPVLLGVRAAVKEAGAVAVAPCPGLSVGCGAVALRVGAARALAAADAVSTSVEAGEVETPGEAEAVTLATAALLPEGLGDLLSRLFLLSAAVAVGGLVALAQALGEVERVAASAPGDGVGVAVNSAVGVRGPLLERDESGVSEAAALSRGDPLASAERSGEAVAAGVALPDAVEARLALPLGVAAATVAVATTVVAALRDEEVEAAAEDGDGLGDRVAASETGMVPEGALLGTGTDPTPLLEAIGVAALLPEAAALAQLLALGVSAAPVGLALALALAALNVAAALRLGLPVEEGAPEAAAKGVAAALRVPLRAPLAVAATTEREAAREPRPLRLALPDTAALREALTEGGAELVPASAAVGDAMGVKMPVALAAGAAESEAARDSEAVDEAVRAEVGEGVGELAVVLAVADLLQLAEGEVTSEPLSAALVKALLVAARLLEMAPLPVAALSAVASPLGVGLALSRPDAELES